MILTGQTTKKKKINQANLEDTVYFHVKTKGFPNGSSIKLQLFDQDTFLDDKKFGGEEIYKTITINNNEGCVELYLPDKWSIDLKNEAWCSVVKIYHRKLYWKFTYKGIKNHKINTFLRIHFSNNQLYIKPSPVDETFPEIYSVEGELMHIVKVQVCDFVRDKATGKIIQAIEKGAANYALNKMEKGYMVDNQGVIHKVGESKYVQNTRIEGMTVSNSEGLIIQTRQSKHFTYSKIENGTRVIHTTKGIDQHGFWVNKYESKFFHVKGLLKYSGEIFDAFNLMEFAMNPDKNAPMPMFSPIPGFNLLWDVIGIIAYDKFNEIEIEHEERLQRELDAAKLQGLGAVKNLVKQYGFKNAGYKTWDISSQTASNIIHGKYKSINEIISSSFDNDSDKNITILYIEKKHPISNKEIVIIETFFTNTNE